MSSRVRKVVAIGVSLAALSASMLPANAVVNSQCGGAVNGDETCGYPLAGPDLSVTGSVASGAVAVEIRDPAGRILLRCSSSRGQCQAFTAHTPNLGPGVTAPTGIPLTCVIFSSSTGTYLCGSRTL